MVDVASFAGRQAGRQEKKLYVSRRGHYIAALIASEPFENSRTDSGQL